MPKVASGQGEDFGTLQALVLLAIGTEITKTVKSKNCKKIYFSWQCPSHGFEALFGQIGPNLGYYRYTI